MKSDDDYTDPCEWFEDTILPRCLEVGEQNGMQLPCFILTVAATGASMMARVTQSAPHQRTTLEVLSAHDVDDGLPLPLRMTLADTKGVTTVFAIEEL